MPRSSGKEPDMIPAEKKKRFVKVFLWSIAFLFPLVLLTFLRMQCTASQGGEPGTDSFYHAAMALQGSGSYTAKKFSFLVFSLWHETFADKELLYHILLQGLFFLQKMMTGDSFPFTFPAMVFAAFALFSFLVLLKGLQISPVTAFLSGILFSFGAFAFTYRFLMLRPHVFSLAFLLICCTLFRIRDLRKKCAGFFLLAFLYAWSYSNPHFLLVPVLFYAFFARKEYTNKSILFPASLLAGLLAGYILHPQFPNTFAVWKVQSLDAVLNPLFYGRTLTPKLAPMEMMPGNFAWFRNAIPFYLLCYISLYLFIRLREKGIREKRDIFTPSEKTILRLALLFTAGTFFILRFIEYALPFTVAAFAVLTEHSEREKTGFFAWKIPEKRVFLLFFAFSAVFMLINITLMQKSNFKNKIPRGPAEYLVKNTPANSLVVNLDWGDFPAMFYANRHNVFLWGMDPAFSYAVSPEKGRKLENCVLNSIRRPAMDTAIRHLTGADFAFVLSRREKFIRYLKAQGWKVVYESEEGCIFTLKKQIRKDQKWILKDL
ncbi:MAG: hypothetical protein IKA79_00660 [Lentisphaeria bacterium]|nr:hypothetical protein [Lentisphaeria bacterium]